MSSSFFKPLVLLAVLAAFPVIAAERFYQVIGPDGRPQMVVSPTSEGRDSSVEAEAAKKAEAEAINKSGATEKSKKGFWSRLFSKNKSEEAKTEEALVPVANETPLADAPAKPAAPPPGWAPYDSDSYLDSETLEKSNFNPEQKNRFYLLNDGTRIRAEEGLSEASEPIFAERPESSVAARAYIEIPDEFKEVPWEAESGYAPGQACLDTALVRKARVLSDSQLAGVILDRKALTFVKPGQVLQGFELGNHEGGWLIVRSYATTARKPSYARPVIVLADKQGCVQRTLTAYFRWHYAATKTRYSELEGEIKLAPNEVLAFVVVPKNQTDLDNEAYRLSRTGKLGIKWVR